MQTVKNLEKLESSFEAYFSPRNKDTIGPWKNIYQRLKF